MNLGVPDKKYPRYSHRPFPPYRFIPGENPHPTEHPSGHSYKKISEQPPRLNPYTWSSHETYLFGVDLYNYAYWWESHEAFESLWRQCHLKEITAVFLKGLIKISAAFIKWHLKEKRGLEILYVEGLTHLKSVCENETVYMGLDLMDHIAKLSNHFREVIANPSIWPDPYTNYPYITLIDHRHSGSQRF